MTPDARQFQITTLEDDEVRAVLARQFVGRLAYPSGNRVEIRPIGFVRDRDWLFGRMQGGEKIEALLHHRWVAFQVDDIRSPWEWESVVIHGPLQFLDPDAGSEMAAMHARATAALADRISDFGGPDDPGAFRSILFGITVQEISGRRGAMAPAP
jgi:nitroimidazol reductase NimA-like FMN-containing flavoprotein (pyridoxamine 5'-phosphate oxidase superfamily)